MRVCKEGCVLVPPRRPGESQKAPGRLVGCPRSDPSSVICWTHHLPFTSPQDPAPSAGKWDMMRLHPEPSSKGRRESQCPVNSRIALCMPYASSKVQAPLLTLDMRYLLSATLCSSAVQPLLTTPAQRIYRTIPQKIIMTCIATMVRSLT